MTKTKYNTDKAGSIIDPPVLPEFETRLRAAHDTGNQDLIDEVQDEYTKAREKIAKPPRPARSSGSTSRASTATKKEDK